MLCSCCTSCQASSELPVELADFDVFSSSASCSSSGGKYQIPDNFETCPKGGFEFPRRSKFCYDRVHSIILIQDLVFSVTVINLIIKIFTFSEIRSLSKLCNESDWCAFFVLDTDQEYCKILEGCTVVPLSDSKRTVYAKKQSRPVLSEGPEGSGSILKSSKSFLPTDDEDY